MRSTIRKYIGLFLSISGNTSVGSSILSFRILSYILSNYNPS
jgi:hypothetical protein